MKGIDTKVDNIVLIGPLGVGKSTIAIELSRQLDIPNYPIDRLKWYYRLKNGYNLAVGTQELVTNGFGGLLAYADGFFGLKELKQVFEEFHGVLDLGASDTVCFTEEKLRGLKELFQPLNNVFLILPSPSVHKSKKVLNQRLKKRYSNHPFKDKVLKSYLEKNEEFITSYTNYELAKHVVYTEGKTVNEVVKEVIGKVNKEKSYSEIG